MQPQRRRPHSGRYRGQLSPAVIIATLRRYPLYPQRPSLARQTWDYAVHLVRREWAKSVEPLRWDLYRIRHDRDFREDVVGSLMVTLFLAWLCLCSPAVRQ
jgi:hypothetical protein